MSTAEKPTRPAYALKVAQTKDEIEACYDIRIEDTTQFPSISSLPPPIPSPPPESSSFLPLPSLSSIADTVTGSSGSTSTSISTATSSKSPVTTAEVTDKPIGTIRFVPTKGKLTRLALDKEYRKYGFGKVLVQGMEDYILQEGNAGRLDKLVEDKDKEGKRVIRVKCHSQIQAKPFYAKMGYVPEGDEFDEDGAPHQLMVHELELTQ